MPGGAPIFAPPGTSSAHNIANVDPGLASHVEPLQIEGAKIHAPPGILPPDPADLLRPHAGPEEAPGERTSAGASECPDVLLEYSSIVTRWVYFREA